MKNSLLQEKLKKAIIIGSKHVALHEGTLCINRCYGISGILSQHSPKPDMICAGEKLCLMPIEKLILMLEDVRKGRGDSEVDGILQPQPCLLDEAKPILSVGTITYEGDDGEDNLLTILSLTDLSDEAN